MSNIYGFVSPGTGLLKLFTSFFIYLQEGWDKKKENIS